MFSNKGNKMQYTHPVQILNQLASLEGTGSMKEKQKIVTDNKDNAHFFNVIRYALDPFKNFYLTTVEGLSSKSSSARKQEKLSRQGYKDLFEDKVILSVDKQFTTMFSLLDDLSSRIIPPNSTQARNAVLSWAEKCNSDTIECFRRILHKDIKCGIGAKTFNKIHKGWVPSFSIQLAEPFNEKKLSFPCYVDPKYDGERCLAFVNVDDKSVMYFSRNGIQFNNYRCFDNELFSLCKDVGNKILDCEVINTKGFQTLQKVPTNYDPNFTGEGLQLVVFDVLSQKQFDEQASRFTQEERYKYLNRMFEKFHSNVIIKVDSKIAKDLNDAYVIFDYWVKKGLEGVILKQIGGNYEFKRSDSWIKLKPKQSEDLVIVDMEFGVDNNKWKDKCGSLVVERTDSKGNRVKVNVASGLTEYDHENIYKEGDSLYYKQPDGQLLNIKGKIIEVIYDCETEDGSLRFPRVKRRGESLIRTDK